MFIFLRSFEEQGNILIINIVTKASKLNPEDLKKKNSKPWSMGQISIEGASPFQDMKHACCPAVPCTKGLESGVLLQSSGILRGRKRLHRLCCGFKERQLKDIIGWGCNSTSLKIELKRGPIVCLELPRRTACEGQ